MATLDFSKQGTLVEGKQAPAAPDFSQQGTLVEGAPPPLTQEQKREALAVEQRLLTQQQLQQDRQLDPILNPPTKGEEGSTFQQIKAGLTQGLAGFSTVINKGAAHIARGVGAEDLASQYDDRAAISQQASGEIEQHMSTEAGPDLARQVSAAATSLLPMLSPYGLAYGTTVAMGQSYLTAKTQNEQHLLNQGYTEQEAREQSRVPSIGAGIVTGIVTAAGGKTGPEALKQIAASQGFKQGALNFLKRTGTESAEEFYDALISGLIDKATIYPDRTYDQIYRDAAHAGILGAIVGAPFAAISTVSGEPQDNRPQDFSQQGTPVDPPQPSAPADQPANSGFDLNLAPPLELAPADFDQQSPIPTPDPVVTQEDIRPPALEQLPAPPEPPVKAPEPTTTESIPFQLGEITYTIEPPTAPEVEPEPGDPLPDLLPSRGSAIDPQEAPLQSVPTSAIAARPDLMQFKRMDQSETGINEQDKLDGDFDPLKGGLLLVWEPLDPSAYDLQGDQRYIVANGHHRHEFARRTGHPDLNVQIIREADGYSAADARALGAEINIADGKGTIQDQAKYIRNQQATHGKDEALARARSIGARGRKAATIGLHAEDHLFESFLNEQVSADQAEAIALTAPDNDAVQRVGIKLATYQTDPVEIQHTLRALLIDQQIQSMENGDLFETNDDALNKAAIRGKAAAAIIKDLKERIRVADQASRNPELARQQGVDFAKSPADIQLETRRLKDLLRRWESWNLHPELGAQVDQYIEAQKPTHQTGDLRFSIDNPDGNAPTYTHDSGPVKAGTPTIRAVLESIRDRFGREARWVARPRDLSQSKESERAALGAALEAFQETFGKRIVIVGLTHLSKGEENLHGWINTADPNTLYVNALSPKGLLSVAGHELIESMAVSDPATYAQLKAQLLPEIRKINVYANRLKGQRKNQRNLHPDERESAIRDIIGDYVGTRIGDPDFLNQIIPENRNLLIKLWEGLKDILATLLGKAAAKGYDVQEFITQSRKIDTAVRDALEQHAQNQSQATGQVIPAQIRQSTEGHDPEQLPRRHPQQIDASADISPEVKQSIYPRGYDPRSNKDDAAQAASIIEANGLPQAETIYTDDHSDLPTAVRTALGHALLKRHAQNESNPQLKDQSIEAQIRIADHIIRRSTDLAQGLQAFAMFHRMTPAGILGTARRQISQVGQTQRQQVTDTTDAVVDGLNQVNQSTTQELPQDQSTQTATTDAINDTIPELPGVKQIITEEATTDTQAQHPDAADTIADHFGTDRPGTLADQLQLDLGIDPETARKKAKQIQQDHKNNTETHRRQARQQIKTQRKQRQQKAKVAADWMRKLGSPWHREADAASKRLGKHAINSKDGKDKSKSALQSFTDRISRELKKTIDQTLARPANKRKGLTHTQVLQEYLQNPDKYRTVWDGVRSQILEHIESNPSDRAALLPLLDHITLTIPQSRIEGAIRDTMRQLGIDLSQIVRQHWTVQDSTGRALAAKLMGDLKMPEDIAVAFAQRIQDRFAALSKERKAKILEQTLKTRTGKKIPKDLVTQLVELSNLGALGTDQHHQAVAAKLKLPTLDQRTQKKLVELANKLQRTPEGFQSDRIGLDILNTIAQTQGINPLDLGMSFWYANTLSGFTTQLLNVFANTLNTGAHAAYLTARHPDRFVDIINSIGTGIRRGALEAAEVIKTGQITGTRNLKLEASRPLELKKFKGIATPLNAWKYVMRVMSAADMLFYKPAEAMHQQMAAHILSKQEGHKGEALNRRTKEILAGTDQHRQAAQDQATREGLTDRDWKRRVEEIIDQQRPQELRETARDYALRVTFNNKPYGILGHIAGAINQVANHVPGLRLFVPFTNIVSNVTNESLSYFPPTGLVRAYIGRTKGELYGRPVKDQSEIHELYAKSAIGAASMIALGLMAWQNLEEEDPRFNLTANGPRDSRRRSQLRETGWIPYSIKFGNRYYSYADTPLAIPLSIVGQFIDGYRYQNIQNIEHAAAVAMMAAPRVLVQRSYLEGIHNLMEALTADPNAKTTQRTISKALRTTSSFAVPNLLKQIDRVFDPIIYKDTDLQSALTEQIPFARRLNKPALNALGEPIQSGPMKRFTHPSDRKDPVWTFIVDNQAWTSLPAQGTLTDNQYYDLIQERGKPLRQAIKSALPRLRQMSPEDARKEIRAISSKQTRAAKDRLKLK